MSSKIKDVKLKDIKSDDQFAEVGAAVIKIIGAKVGDEVKASELVVDLDPLFTAIMQFPAAVTTSTAKTASVLATPLAKRTASQVASTVTGLVPIITALNDAAKGAMVQFAARKPTSPAASLEQHSKEVAAVLKETEPEGKLRSEARFRFPQELPREIGRASCRERV